MTRLLRGVVVGLVACGGGVGLAVAMSGSAGAAGPTTTTLGSTTGSPSMNICVASINCTYLPFDPVGTPELLVPFDGTVTSFSINAGSAGGAVSLRVLRPAGGGQYTGAGTSATETLAAGPNSFTVSLPVKAGDVLGLDNSSSALLFDTTSQTAVAGYYESPALADGSTAAPNHRADYRLLMSAVVQSSGSGTTTSVSNGTTTVTVTNTVTTAASGARPVLTALRQSRRSWPAAVGTTFSFRLSQPALITLTFRKGGRTQGKVVALGRSGLNQIRFRGLLSNGSRLPAGRYSVAVVAANPSGASRPAGLRFTIRP